MQRSRKARMRRKQRRRWYIALLSVMVFVLAGSLFFFLNSTTDQHQQYSAYDLNQQNQSRYDLNLSFDGHFNSKFHNETRNKLRELEHKRYWDTSTEDLYRLNIESIGDYSENRTMLSRRWQTRDQMGLKLLVDTCLLTKIQL